jgi:LysM repeat protein
MARVTPTRTLLLALVLLSALTLTAALAQESTPQPTVETRVGETVYTVQIGDVLERIAAAYDVSTVCLAEINAIPVNGNLLFPGDSIIISASCPPYQGELPVENPRVEGSARNLTLSGNYIVQVADTVDTIAQSYNVSVISLFAVNGLDYGSQIFPNDTLIIPTDGAPYGFYPGLVVGNPDGVDFYVVQQFDVLDLIAAYFDVDLACLADFNGLTDPNVLFPGFIVALPAACPPYNGLSSAPVNPLRGTGIGASALMMSGGAPTDGGDASLGGAISIPTTEPTMPPSMTATATPTASVPGVIVETPVGAGDIIRGATVTPTPGG